MLKWTYVQAHSKAMAYRARKLLELQMHHRVEWDFTENANGVYEAFSTIRISIFLHREDAPPWTN